MPEARPIVESDVEYPLSNNCSGIFCMRVRMVRPSKNPAIMVMIQVRFHHTGFVSAIFCLWPLSCFSSLSDSVPSFHSSSSRTLSLSSCTLSPSEGPFGIGPPFSRALIILSSTFTSPTLEWLPSVAMVEFEATERSDGGGLNCRVHRMANVCSKRLAEDWANVEGTAAR